MHYINNIHHYFKYMNALLKLMLQTLWTINDQYCVYTVNEHETRWINVDRNNFSLVVYYN